jgi:hypothetical protein
MTSSHLKTAIFFALIQENLKNKDKLKDRMEIVFKEITKNIDNIYYQYNSVILPNSNSVTYKNKPLVLNEKDAVYLNAAIDEYRNSAIDVDSVSWYIKSLLNLADSTETIKSCIPPHLHKHIPDMECLGTHSSDKLMSKHHYDLLEEASLKNTLLGI